MGLFDGWNIHAPTSDDQTDTAPYRADAGGWMTDDQYDAWLNGK